MTERELDVMRHALGGAKNFRNYFVASDGGPDAAVWQGLCERGYAISQPYRGAADSTVFFVTDAGRAAVGLPSPRQEGS